MVKGEGPAILGLLHGAHVLPKNPFCLRTNRWAETFLWPWAPLFLRALVISCASVSCLEEGKENCGLMPVQVTLRGAARGGQPPRKAARFQNPLLVFANGDNLGSRVCTLCSHTGLPTSQDLVLGLVLCYCCLEILNIFE